MFEQKQSTAGTVTGRFPKPGEKGTWVIVISPDDGSPGIYEEMTEVSDKSELPVIGEKVDLESAYPTWRVKF